MSQTRNIFRSSRSGLRRGAQFLPALLTVALLVLGPLALVAYACSDRGSSRSHSHGSWKPRWQGHGSQGGSTTPPPPAPPASGGSGSGSGGGTTNPDPGTPGTGTPGTGTPGTGSGSGSGS